MHAMILAAGRGERLRPLTDRTPKPLVKVGGETLIARHLRRLSVAGFREVAINLCHLGDEIRRALGDGASFGLRIRYSEEKRMLGTAGGIRLAMERGLLGSEDPFLCVNADVVCDADFAGMRLATSDDCHLLLVPNPPGRTRGDFSLLDGRVIPPSHDALTYSGIGVYRPQIFDKAPAEQHAEMLPFLQEAISRSAASGALHRGIWHDAGTPEALRQARVALRHSMR